MSTSDFAASILARIEPALVNARAQPAETLREITRLVDRYQMTLLQDWVVRKHARVVPAGPFAGMRYVPQTSDRLVVPKLLGCYESELHRVIRDIARRPYERIINIGCGEGYYAVGFGRLMPRVQVHAFDINDKARELCSEMARLNGVGDRVIVQGACTSSLFSELISQRTLVFCDCEGSELELLDLEQVPELRVADVLVECHDFIQEHISRTMTERFQHSHEVELIPNSWTNPNAVPQLRKLRPILKFLAVWEGRPGLTPWAWMIARQAAAV